MSAAIHAEKFLTSALITVPRLLKGQLTLQEQMPLMAAYMNAATMHLTMQKVAKELDTSRDWLNDSLNEIKEVLSNHEGYITGVT